MPARLDMALPLSLLVEPIGAWLDLGRGTTYLLNTPRLTAPKHHVSAHSTTNDLLITIIGNKVETPSDEAEISSWTLGLL